MLLHIKQANQADHTHHLQTKTERASSGLLLCNMQEGDEEGRTRLAAERAWLAEEPLSASACAALARNSAASFSRSRALRSAVALRKSPSAFCALLLNNGKLSQPDTEAAGTCTGI